MIKQGSTYIVEEVELDTIISSAVNKAIAMIGADKKGKSMTRSEAMEYLRMKNTLFSKYFNRAENPIPSHGSGYKVVFYEHELDEWRKSLKTEQ